MYEVKISKDRVLRRCISSAMSDFINRNWNYYNSDDYESIRDCVTEMLWDSWHCRVVLNIRRTSVRNRIEIRSVMFRNESAYTWFILRWG